MVAFLRRAHTYVVLALFAVSASAAAAVHQRSATVSATLVERLASAEHAAAASGKQGVAILVLGRNELSQIDDAMVVHGSAARFALRKLDLVVLRENRAGRYTREYLPGECDGIVACAQDSFLNASFSTHDVQKLRARASQWPVLAVFKGTQPKASAWAYGLSSELETVEFVDAALHADATHPLRHYGNSLLTE